jgi:hypothetical protein
MAEEHDTGPGDSALDVAVARFEAAWLQGKQPTIEEFLPSDGSPSDALLWELVHR